MGIERNTAPDKVKQNGVILAELLLVVIWLESYLVVKGVVL